MRQTQALLAPFREIQVKFSRLYSRILCEADLTLPQYALLSLLVMTGECSMTEVSQRLHISKPAVTHLVDHLEEKKFLKRCPVKDDRRVYRLAVTTKGKSTTEKIQGRIFQFLLSGLKNFNESERKIITSFYTQMALTLDDFIAREKSL